MTYGCGIIALLLLGCTHDSVGALTDDGGFSPVRALEDDAIDSTDEPDVAEPEILEDLQASEDLLIEHDEPDADDPLNDEPLQEEILVDSIDSADDVATDYALSDLDADEELGCFIESDVIGLWSGYWAGSIYGEFPIVGEFDLPASGELSFEIYCEEGKLFIGGEMEGLAEGLYPFSGDIVGEYNPESHEIEMDLVNAAVYVEGLRVEFEVELLGDVEELSVTDGIWYGSSLIPPGASGDGTWDAAQTSEETY